MGFAMTKQKIITQHHATFEGIRHVDADGNEFWLARVLAKTLDYSEYRHFLPVVERAREACLKIDQRIEDHFEDILDMVEIGSGAKRELSDIRLSRYACYLIVQNGDPSKIVIANGQTYFAMQTAAKSWKTMRNLPYLMKTKSASPSAMSWPCTISI
jgi:DNA-damage-inducible protein D